MLTRKECLKIEKSTLFSPRPSPPTRFSALLHCVQMMSCSYTTKVAEEKRGARDYCYLALDTSRDLLKP